MTDQELNSLLQEWKHTPAPPVLEERLFEPRPVPIPWWNRVPALPLAAAGAVLGFLLVLGLSSLFREQPAPLSEPASAGPAPTAKAPLPEVPAPQEKAKAPRPVPAKRKQPAVPETITKSRPIPTNPVNPTSARPIVTNQPQPVFPDNLPIELSYTVTIVRVRIAKDGSVLEAEVLEGAPELNDIALEAVRQWRLEPRMLNNEPIEFETRLEVKFSRPAPKGKAVPRPKGVAR